MFQGILKFAKGANMENKSYTLEMEEYFKKRTFKHIGFVRKFTNRMIKSKELMKGLDTSLIKKEGVFHDPTKFQALEYDPYVHITWMYKLKDEGKKHEVSDDIKKQIEAATMHHVRHNKHHPEYWDPDVRLIDFKNRDRDKPGRKIVDGTKMPMEYIAAMACDWMAMSLEKDTDPYKWAKDNVGIRWKFTKKQEDFIYKILDAVWRN